MEATSSIVLASDPRWGCRNIVELASAAFDPDMQSIGSSPYVGDMASTGLLLPTAPTTSQTTRYLVRLLGIQIPKGAGLLIRGLRQAATIRGLVESLEGVSTPFEHEIESPFWHFADGNISWHLKWHMDSQFAQVVDPAQLPGTDPDFIGLETALVYDTLLPYVPPNNGIPPSRDVAHYGTWRDIRFPWTNTAWTMSVLVPGPGLVVYYASVHQTDPATRPAMLVPAETSALRIEDQFLQAFPNAIYGRVAGAMTVELLPCCQEKP
jgi:hypothetical protein